MVALFTMKKNKTRSLKTLLLATILAGVLLFSQCVSAHSLEYYSSYYDWKATHIHIFPENETNLTVMPVYNDLPDGWPETMFGISSWRRNPPLPFYELKTRTDEDGDAYVFLYSYMEYQFTFPEKNKTYYLYPVESEYDLYVPS